MGHVIFCFLTNVCVTSQKESFLIKRRTLAGNISCETQTFIANKQNSCDTNPIKLIFFFLLQETKAYPIFYTDLLCTPLKLQRVTLIILIFSAPERKQLNGITLRGNLPLFTQPQPLRVNEVSGKIYA